jgi:hypothetical protein
MKTTYAWTTLLVLVCAGNLVADDGQLTPEEAEALMMELGTPGEEHERFKGMVGHWNCEIRMYVEGVDEPIVSEGHSDFELIFDGRFLVQDFEGNMAGMTFSGHGMTGYDRAQEKYVGFWADSMSTGMMSMEGTVDEETGIMTEFATMAVPGGEMKMKMESKQESDDEYHFTMYMGDADGNYVKHLEIIYTRAAE